MSYRERYRVPGRIPDESLALFGADPSWTPIDEDQPGEACGRCGGVGPDGSPNWGDRDPIRPSEVVAIVCAACYRSPWDGRPGALDAEARRHRALVIGEDEPIEGGDKQDKDGKTGAAVDGKGGLG